MLLPPEPRAGQPLQATWGAAVIRYLRSITPRPSVDIQVDRTANGTTFRPRPVPQVSRSSSGDAFPFRIVDASTTEPDVAKVRVTYGTVNNIVPEIGASPLNADPAPVLSVATGHVYLDCTIGEEDGLATAVAVANAADVPEDTSTHAYISIGYVTVVDGAVTLINQGVQHSLWHQRCPADDPEAENLFWAV
jgi:hypothetical protein